MAPPHDRRRLDSVLDKPEQRESAITLSRVTNGDQIAQPSFGSAVVTSLQCQQVATQAPLQRELQPNGRRAPLVGQLGANAKVEGTLQHHLFKAGYDKALDEMKPHINRWRAIEAVQAQEEQAAQLVVPHIRRLQEAIDSLQKELAAAKKQVAEAAHREAKAAADKIKAAVKSKAETKAAVEKLKAALKDGEAQRVQREVLRLRKDDVKTHKEEAAKAARDAKEAAQVHERELEQLRLQNEMARLAVEQAVSKVHGVQTAHGIAQRALEHYRAAEAKRAEQAGNITLRIKLAELQKEVLAARANNANQRAEILKLEKKLAEEKEASKTKGFAKLVAPRTSGLANAPLTARSMEYLRRLCEECNCSFEGAHTAIALMLAMYLEDGPTEAQLVSSVSIRRAFEKLGIVDNDLEKLANKLSTQYWALGCDGGNKGRAIEMIAYCMWDEKKGKPVAKPLAASDLFSDQMAANGERTLMRAVMRLGLQAALGVSCTSDGTEHAVQESCGFLEALWQKLPEGTLKKSTQEFCCIHGKALEENAGLDALCSHGAHLVDALRLLWEIIASPEGGRPDEYRDLWVRQRLGGDLFDSTLGSMAELTAAKWQVMFDLCVKLLPILEPVTGDPDQKSDIEKILDAWLLANQGSTNTHSPVS